MNVNFLGVERNFSIYAGRETRFIIELQEASTQEALDVDNVAFALSIDVAGVVTAAAIASSGNGSLSVVIPALDEGRYAYELTAQGTDGAVGTLMRGWLGVCGTLSTVSATQANKQTMVLAVPDTADYITMAWRASTAVEQTAVEMTTYVDDAMATAVVTMEEAVTDAQGYAEAAADTAAGITGVAEMHADATLALTKLEEVDSIVAASFGSISDYVYPNTVTNTWVVGGYETDAPSKGSDGVDGSSIKRIVVDSVDDLPSPDDYNGSDIYYVPRTSLKSSYVVTIAPADGYFIAVFNDNDAVIYINDTAQERAEVDGVLVSQICVSCVENAVLKFNPLTTKVYFYE